MHRTRTTRLRHHNNPAPAGAGFSLIELLVVVASLSVLLTMLLPALSRARAIARANVCRSQLHQLSLAAVASANEHDGRLPSHILADPSGGPARPWQQTLADFVPAGVEEPARLICPEHKPAKALATGYLYNIHFNAVSLETLAAPASAVLFWDDLQQASTTGARPSNTAPGGAGYAFAFRHLDACQLGLVDGSVQSIEPTASDAPRAHEYPGFLWDRSPRE